MTKRRGVRLLAALTLFVIGAGTASAAYWPVQSWWRGTPTYQGRPADWWAAEVERTYHAEMQTSVGYGWVQRRLPAWQAALNEMRGRAVFAAEAIQPPPLAAGDPAALPVLAELLRDERPKVRQLAADGLGRLRATPGPARTLLLAAAADPDPVVRDRIANALHDLATDAH